MHDKTRVGERIREIRDSQDLSVAELAERSQCSPEVIEQLEAGQMTPSLAPLLKIARGLGVRLGALLDDDPHPGAVVVRAGQSENVVRFSGIRTASMSTLDFHPLAQNKQDRHMEPFIIDVHPTVDEDCLLSAHEGEEFIYVLSGQIDVTYGKDLYRLSPGDSIYYDSVVPHEVRAAGDAPAKIVAVVYTPV